MGFKSKDLQSLIGIPSSFLLSSSSSWSEDSTIIVRITNACNVSSRIIEDLMLIWISSFRWIMGELTISESMDSMSIKQNSPLWRSGHKATSAGYVGGNGEKSPIEILDPNHIALLTNRYNWSWETLVAKDIFFNLFDHDRQWFDWWEIQANLSS